MPALEQRDAERLLQRLHLPRQRRLREEELLGRQRERQAAARRPRSRAGSRATAGGAASYAFLQLMRDMPIARLSTARPAVSEFTHAQSIRPRAGRRKAATVPIRDAFYACQRRITMACFDNGTIIDLAPRETVILPDMRGATLRVARGTVGSPRKTTRRTSCCAPATRGRSSATDSRSWRRRSRREHVRRRAADRNAVRSRAKAHAPRDSAWTRVRDALGAFFATPTRNPCPTSDMPGDLAMPLVTLTRRRTPRRTAFKRRGARRACTSRWSPPACRKPTASSACSNSTPADFRFDPRYPDLASDRGDDVRADRDSVVGGPQREGQAQGARRHRGRAGTRPGLDPEHVMIVFKETAVGELGVRRRPAAARLTGLPCVSDGRRQCEFDGARRRTRATCNRARD